MSLLKYLERAKRIDELIHRKATGNSEQFSRKLGISRSVLMEHLRDLKELGAPIRFCCVRQSYFYDGDFGIIISQTCRAKSLVGGSRFVKIIEESDMNGLPETIFMMQSLE
jgi:hypothetical protein